MSVEEKFKKSVRVAGFSKGCKIIVKLDGKTVIEETVGG